MKKVSLKSLIMITLGCFIFASTINIFLITNQMGQGGVSGLSIMLFYAFDIPISVSYFLINAILLAIGYRYLEKSTILYTLYSVGMITLFLKLTAGWHYTFEQEILIPIVVGILIGISVGLVLISGGSTAGLDIIALILKRYFHIATSNSLFVLDMLIIIPSAFIIGFEKMIYTLIMAAITAKTIDYILEGLNPKKSVVIISKHHQAIADAIMKDVQRGITVVHGHGHFSQEDKRILYVVISRRQIINVTRIVNTIDNTAFMTVSSVHSVSGEGFTFHLADINE